METKENNNDIYIYKKMCHMYNKNNKNVHRFPNQKNVCTKEVRMLGDSQTAAAHPAKSKRRLIHKMCNNFGKRKRNKLTATIR